MITDAETNFLYLADCLPNKQPSFFHRFEKVLTGLNIPYQFLPTTKDIWAVDFMPIQVKKDKFVQFAYNPDYLKEKKYHNLVSDSDAICKAINIPTIKSNLIVDGGNVIRTTDKVIMSEKVFHENKSISEQDLIKQLSDLFEVENLCFVPWDENDIIGHADGMVRFIDSNTVLINDYSKESKEFQRRFRLSLRNVGLDWIELPYNPPPDIKSLSATGIYINYLQMKQALIMPIFRSKHDEKALKVLEDVFKGQTIATVESSDLAEEGGILNCISWNIIE